MDEGKVSGVVVSLHGGPTGSLEPNEACIEVLERWLEMARSGQVVGVAVAGLEHDGCGRWETAGMIGGYSMIGAIEVMRSAVVDVARE